MAYMSVTLWKITYITSLEVAKDGLDLCKSENFILHDLHVMLIMITLSCESPESILKVEEDKKFRMKLTK